MIKVTIPTYEELTDADGKIYTVYNVFVEEKKTSMRWLLRKRYSAFQALHAALKEQFPDVVEPFRFPHKSMFNTFSNYTKERRRQGFDDFLKILVALSPLPVEVAKFLELDDHVWPQAADLPEGKAGDNTAQQGGRSSDSNASHNLAEEREFQKSFITAGPRTAAISSKDLMTTLRTTFIVTSTIYVMCISFGVIDASASSWSQMALTLLLLGSIFTLLRVVLLKREYQMAIAESQAEQVSPLKSVIASSSSAASAPSASTAPK